MKATTSKLKRLLVLDVTAMLHSSVLSAQGIQEVEPPELPARGSFEVRKEGGLSGVEVGLARFEPDKKQEVDGQPAFVVALHTGAIEGGIFLAFGGEQRPAPAEYELVPVEIRGSSGFQDVELGAGEVALFYFESSRNHMVLLGSIGDGLVEILASEGEHIQGRFELEVSGAAGNPRALMNFRPRRGTLLGAFDATPGEVDFRKP